MKITLIYSGIGVAGMNSNRHPGDREGSWIGHGIASIGASLLATGHEVELIDLRQLSGWEEFAEIIKANPAEMYGISVSAVDYVHALKAVLEIKTHTKKGWVVVGGIHPTIFPEKYDFAAINTVIQGEGEISFVELIRDYQAGLPIPHIIQGKKPDLSKLPWVARELFDYKRETQCNFAPDQQTPSVTMLAGRGCPYHCSYCQPAENAVFGHPYRMRSPQDVVDELAYLKGLYAFESVTFWDDTFTFRPKWIGEFCDLYERQGFQATIAACSRADIICKNEAMIERLAEVGLDWFVIGLESGSQRVLDLIKKGTTVEQNKEAARICRKYGIKIFGTYMYGLPTETTDEALQTARMIDEIQPEHPSPFWYTPIPGTGLYDYCVENGLLLRECKERTVERTGRFLPALKGVDYGHLENIMNGYRG
jgi:anaerobic magnesium-protoporphyrin IX monomethyl ester cyclase